MAALNKEYGTEWSNNSEVKELATEALNKIADGKIALTAIAAKKETEKNYVQLFVLRMRSRTLKCTRLFTMKKQRQERLRLILIWLS